jgi:hypothetical protein
MSETAVNACNESLKVEPQDLDGDGLITTTEIEAQRYNEMCQTELIQKIVATGYEGTGWQRPDDGTTKAKTHKR